MSTQTWIAVGAKGTNLILETKNKLKILRQKNSNNQNNLRRQLAYFRELEADAGDLDKPSFSMKSSLAKLQKPQTSTKQSLTKVSETIDDLTCMLAEIQYETGINQDHVKELDE